VAQAEYEKAQAQARLRTAEEDLGGRARMDRSEAKGGGIVAVELEVQRARVRELSLENGDLALHKARLEMDLRQGTAELTRVKSQLTKVGHTVEMEKEACSNSMQELLKWQGKAQESARESGAWHSKAVQAKADTAQLQEELSTAKAELYVLRVEASQGHDFDRATSETQRERFAVMGELEEPPSRLSLAFPLLLSLILIVLLGPAPRGCSAAELQKHGAGESWGMALIL
jgi:chromosome segregation ATPase